MEPRGHRVLPARLVLTADRPDHKVKLGLPDPKDPPVLRE